MTLTPAGDCHGPRQLRLSDLNPACDVINDLCHFYLTSSLADVLPIRQNPAVRTIHTASHPRFFKCQQTACAITLSVFP